MRYRRFEYVEYQIVSGLSCSPVGQGMAGPPVHRAVSSVHGRELGSYHAASMYTVLLSTNEADSLGRPLHQRCQQRPHYLHSRRHRLLPDLSRNQTSPLLRLSLTPRHLHLLRHLRSDGTVQLLHRLRREHAARMRSLREHPLRATISTLPNSTRPSTRTPLVQRSQRHHRATKQLRHHSQCNRHRHHRRWRTIFRPRRSLATHGRRRAIAQRS